MRFKNFFSVWILCGLLFLHFPPSVFSTVGENAEVDQEIILLEKFSTIYNLLHRYYVKPLTKQKLIEKAIAGMLSGLDPYTRLMSRQEVEELELESLGKFKGIGVSTQKIEEKIVVTQVYAGSPAAGAGIRPGDIITTINNHPLADITVQKLTSLTRSDTNTHIVLTFYHPELKDKKKTVKLYKNWVQIKSVKAYPMPPKLLTIQIGQFQKSTPDELKEVITRYPLPVVILDLRNNPGGLLLAAVESTEIFLTRGLIVETRDKHNKVIKRYISRRGKNGYSPHLIVLINRFTASAAEIFAGALKERGKAQLFGERSFGKGVVQSILPVTSDLYLKVTTAKYYTPSGKEIHHIGITPDHLIKDTNQIPRYQQNDPIFQKAKLSILATNL